MKLLSTISHICEGMDVTVDNGVTGDNRRFVIVGGLSEIPAEGGLWVICRLLGTDALLIVLLVEAALL